MKMEKESRVAGLNNFRLVVLFRKDAFTATILMPAEVEGTGTSS